MDLEMMESSANCELQQRQISQRWFFGTATVSHLRSELCSVAGLRVANGLNSNVLRSPRGEAVGWLSSWSKWCLGIDDSGSGFRRGFSSSFLSVFTSSWLLRARSSQIRTAKSIFEHCRNASCERIVVFCS
jgi:hypothetical protein